MAVAEAQIKLANEERELASLECDRIEAQIEQRRLRSPIDGVVVEVMREVGESTQISDPRLLTLVQLLLAVITYFATLRGLGEYLWERQAIIVQRVAELPE